MVSTNEPGHDRPEPSGPRPSQHPGESQGFPWLMLLIVLVALVGIGFLVVKRRSQSASATKGPGRAGASTNAVPVLIGTVEQMNVPIFLDGLGTVQAFNTVTVRSRVDGQLRKLAFKDGQDVHAGDLLAEIDSAPFEAQVG